MRFKKRNPKFIWSEEQTKSKVNEIRKDISDLSRESMEIYNKIGILKHEKNSIDTKIKRKHIYLNQLSDMLSEYRQTRANKEYNEKNNGLRQAIGNE